MRHDIKSGADGAWRKDKARVLLGRSDSRIESWTISGRSVPNNTLHLIRTRRSQTEKPNFTVQADHERTSQSASQRIANAVCEEYLYYVSLFSYPLFPTHHILDSLHSHRPLGI